MHVLLIILLSFVVIVISIIVIFLSLIIITIHYHYSFIITIHSLAHHSLVIIHYHITSSSSLPFPSLPFPSMSTMQSKKLVNRLEDVVTEALDGLLALDSDVARIGDFNACCRADIETYKANHVTIISGGGSGHEPAHAGFIGDGMLSGAVWGNVFASPSVSSILATIRVCAGPKGLLLVVKNYTGDRLNFGMAMEKAKNEGISCKMIIVDDDVALPEGKGITGGRGVAGVVFVHKIAGAVASYTTSTLDDVYEAATDSVKNIRTLGIATTTCTIPGCPRSDRLAADDIMEVGMGIHGEPGRQQLSISTSNAANQVADILVEAVLGRLQVNEGEKVAILINNLGGLPHIELLIVARKIIQNLHEKNILIIRANTGYYVTSLEMSGLSLTIMKIENETVLSHLDQSTTAPAWGKTTKLQTQQVIPYDEGIFTKKISGGPPCPKAYEITKAICENIIVAEPMLTNYDMICGDGDCGIVMKAGASKVLLDLELNSTVNDSATFCDNIATSISASMGGTSGALLEIFFRAMGTFFVTNNQGSWPMALRAGLTAIKVYGGAQIGMRTMIDSLEPGIDALLSADIAVAVEKAAEGCEQTKQLASLAGRSNYIDNHILKGVPDPGAVAVKIAFESALQIIH